MRFTSLGAACATATLFLAVGACGKDDSTDRPGSDHSDSDHSGSDHSGSANQPDATPADKVDGKVTSGRFRVLDTAPPGSGDVAGQAWLAQNGDGSTVTVRFTGLEPKTEYLAHLHDQSCAQDRGGDHFKFDADGGSTPPNEIHLAFTSTATGTGQATVTNPKTVQDKAPAIVVHPTDAMDNRLACADFS